MAPYSSMLAWKIPWTEVPERLQSMGLLRVGHDWATSHYFSLLCIGEGNGNPLQCSCLENPRDGGAGGLPSMGSHRVGHDWSDLAVAAADCIPPGSSVHGILQVKILEWVAISFSRGFSQPGDQTSVFYVSWIGRQILNHCATWEACL